MPLLRFAEGMRMIEANIREVTKRYNWRGEFVGYQAGATSIPADPANTDFCLLRDRIERGECSEQEPKFTCAIKVFGEDGKVSGYDTDLGFVPNDNSNMLNQLFIQSVSVGSIVIAEPQLANEDEKISALLLCGIFDHRWHHLEGPIEKKFPYLLDSHNQTLEIVIRVKNIPPKPDDVSQKLTDSFGLESNLPCGMLYKSLQCGAIEVEVPVEKLQKLFRKEHRRLPATIKPFIDDSLALHYARSARSKSKGPNIQWLLMEARYFLAGFFADMANMAIRAFTLEFGGVPPGHILEDDLLRSHLLFARCQSGKLRLHSMQFQREHSFALKGYWPDGRSGMMLRDPIMRKHRDFWEIRSRIRQLISAGFAIEALVVANALIETILKESLKKACRDQEDQVRLEKISHAGRLDILFELTRNATHPGFCSDEFTEFLDATKKIYAIRNAYAHELTLPVEDSWKIVDMDRLANNLLKFFLSPHLASITFGTIGLIATSPTGIASSIIHSELDRRFPKRRWKAAAEWLLTRLRRAFLGSKQT